MSLPPGFLDELRTRLSLGQVVGRKVMWDARKTNQAKGDLWAPCPFHQEKTASFHVDDRKGYYYCFGCHAKGDAISFVRETENVSFMEAVEILAREAGMPMPQRDPQAREKADRRSQLAEVMEQAVQFFRLQMHTGAAAAAREYLLGRGLDPEAQERWEIGFAPNGWQALGDHLRGKGVPDDLVLGAGLAKPPRKADARPYDTFRNRIMFPIRDARGRCIAFGGRAMDPDDPAKYLNSPETELFDKSRSLYNHGPARAASGRGQPLIVAEGYMDVIALCEHGFDASVAPLGTAVTDTQLQMMWRIADEPVIALDGDAAGLRAAMRLIDLALPMLEAGRSLRFVLLPEGQDPDDLLRSQGAGAMRKLLDDALPMVRLLWQRETEGRVFDSPERKAALDKSLREKIQLIRDPSVQRHYEADIRDLRWKLFSARRSGPNAPRGSRKFGAPAPAMPSTRTSALGAGQGAAVAETLRESVILAVVIAIPDLAESFERGLENMPCRTRDHARLRDLILRHAHEGTQTLREQIDRAMGRDALEKLYTARHVAVVPCIRNPGDIEMARMTVAEELAKLEAAQGLAAEIAEAAEDLAGTADEGVTWRLSEAARAAAEAGRVGHDNTEDFEVGPNGARINRGERQAFAALMENIRFAKPKR